MIQSIERVSPTEVRVEWSQPPGGVNVTDYVVLYSDAIAMKTEAEFSDHLSTLSQEYGQEDTAKPPEVAPIIIGAAFTLFGVLIATCGIIIGCVLCTRSLTLINPRRACAARVTVVVLCVCVCVCVFVCPRPSSATRATKRQTRHTGCLSIVLTSVKKGVFRIMASFRR